MSTVDWASMSPLEVYNAIRAAPKVVGPWIDGAGSRTDHVRCHINGTCAATVFSLGTKWYWYTFPSEWKQEEGEGRTDSEEAAKEAADASLTAAGFGLVLNSLGTKDK